MSMGFGQFMNLADWAQQGVGLGVGGMNSDAEYDAAFNERRKNLEDYGYGDELLPEFERMGAINLRDAWGDQSEDPQLRGRQLQVLDELLRAYDAGGMTAEDIAAFRGQQNEANAAAGARTASSLQGLQQRGLGNSGLGLAATMGANQMAAQNNAAAGTQFAGDSRARAMRALMGAGSQAGQVRGQDFQRQQALADSQNAINRFNAQMGRQATTYNNQMAQNKFGNKLDLNSARGGAREALARDREGRGKRAKATANDWSRWMSNGAEQAGGGGFGSLSGGGGGFP